MLLWPQLRNILIGKEIKNKVSILLYNDGIETDEVCT